MSFQLLSTENGIKVTTKLRHLGNWLQESLSRVFQDAARQNAVVYLDLGCVLYVDETISHMIREACAQSPRVQLVGYPRGLRPKSEPPEAILAA